MEIEVLEYISPKGVPTFQLWFNRLPALAAAKITTAIARMQSGNLANCKRLSKGLLEYKINHGPGYRIYFGISRGNIILLLGGTKKKQARDIKTAQGFWRDFKNVRGKEQWH